MSTQITPALVAVEVEEREAPATVPFYLPRDIGPAILRLEEGRFTAADFEIFAAANSDLRLEMNKEGEMIVMMAAGLVSSHRNGKLTARLFNWAEVDDAGMAFDSSAGFKLPNGAERSPNASWIRHERWKALTQEERETFWPLCPDFVVELRSRTDRLKAVQAKMEEYIENGAQLGWLIDPLKKKVHIYRPDAPIEILDNPTEVFGEPLLKGFTLKLAGILV